MTGHSLRTRTLAAQLLLVSFTVAFAQPRDEPALLRARDGVAANRNLSSAEKGQIQGMYDSALRSLAEVTQFRVGRLGQQRRKAALLREREALEQELRQPDTSADLDTTFETARDAEEALDRALTEQNVRLRVLNELTQATATLAKRQQEISQRRIQLRQDEEKADDQLSAVQIHSASEAWETAARAQAQTGKQAIEAEREMLQAESESTDTMRSLIPLQRDAAKLRLEAAQRTIEMLKIRSRDAQAKDARRELDRATRSAAVTSAAYPQLDAIARQVTGLAIRLWGRSGAILSQHEVLDQTQRMRQLTLRVNGIAAAIGRRYQAVGRFAPSSEWLQGLPPDMPKLNEVIAARRARLSTAAQLRRELINLAEAERAEGSLESQVEQVRAAFIRSGSAVPDGLESATRQLLQQRRNLTEDLLKATQELDRAISDFSSASLDLTRQLEAIRDFARKRVLWSRSVDNVPTLSATASAALWFVWNPGWGEVWQALAGWRIIALALLLAMALDFTERRRGRSSPRILRFIAMLGVPALLAVLAYAIPDDSGALARAIGAGSAGAAVVLIVLWLAGHPGAGRWSGATREAFVRELGWLSAILPAGCFIVLGLVEAGPLVSQDATLRAHNNSLGRLVFVGMCLCLLAACLRLFHPAGPLVQELRQRLGGPVISRFTSYRAVVGLLFLVPAALGVAGFYATALVLARGEFWTLVISAALAVLSSRLHRWREAQRAAIQGDSLPEPGRAEAADAQVRQLIRFAASIVWIAAMLVVWDNALPALSLLDDVHLTSAGTRSSQAAVPRRDDLLSPMRVTPALPAPEVVSTMPATQPLTLLDVLKAVAAALGMLVLVRNLPGLLDFILLERFRLHSGTVYASATIVRYLLVVIGVAVTSNILGINWSQVQWLAAALTFGIGFGLQEVFANLASGVILLLDRSIRVGDAVSVGEWSGRVSRIQMRATTVTLWNRSEMVVPNKEFITSKLINWTLSLPESRVELKVGVAYGSDLDLVRATLHAVAQANPNVLKDPAPEVLLTSFGEGSIDFELRAFCLYEFGRAILLDQLHSAVYREFEQKGILFAQPSLAVQLRSKS